MRCDPGQIFQKSKLTEKLRYRDGQTSDIIEVIMGMDAESDKYIKSVEALDCLLGASDYETLHNVWKFVKQNVRYKPDRRGKEVVKSPAALFEIGHGDCKSFSIAEVALLRALGFKGIRYRFTAYEPGDVTHVYVVCRLNGKDVILDAVHSKFDDEVRYYSKRDIKAATSISGIGAVPQKSNYTNLVILGLLAWYFSK